MRRAVEVLVPALLVACLIGLGGAALGAVSQHRIDAVRIAQLAILVAETEHDREAVSDLWTDCLFSTHVAFPEDSILRRISQ